MQIKILTLLTTFVIVFESLTFKEESKPQITELPSLYDQSFARLISTLDAIMKPLKLILAFLFMLGERKAAKSLILINSIWIFYFGYQLYESFYQNKITNWDRLPDDEDPLKTLEQRKACMQQEDTSDCFQQYGGTSSNKETMLHECMQEVQNSLIVIGALSYVISSSKYGPSAWLRRFYRGVRRNVRNAQIYVEDANV